MLDLDELLAGLDRGKIAQLTDRELCLLQVLTGEKENTTNRGIAGVVFFAPETIHKNFGEIFKKLGIDNRVQAGLLYIAAGRPEPNINEKNVNLSPREHEIFLLLAKGLTPVKIGDRLGIFRNTVNSHFESIYRKLKVGTSLEAALVGIKKGISDIDKAAEGLDVESNRTLTQKEEQVLQAIVQSNGKVSTNHEIAEVLGYSPSAIQNHFKSIFNKFGVNSKIQAVLLYLIGRREGKIQTVIYQQRASLER